MCFNVIQSQHLEYCSNCMQCKNCFGCSGLKGKEYHIFNKPYSPDQYQALKNQIIAQMKQNGEYGKFFPAYFSPIPYEESWSAAHFELNFEEQQNLGFRISDTSNRQPPTGALSVAEIPYKPQQADDSLYQKVFWDDVAKKPLRIRKQDVQFANKIGVPLPHSFYSRRLKENFSWICFGKTGFG